MKLVQLLHWNYGFLKSLARAVVEVIQAFPTGRGLIKQGPDTLAPVPVLARPRVLRGVPSARNWRA